MSALKSLMTLLLILRKAPLVYALLFYLNNEKECYSYLRWSSDKQSGGSTLSHQLKTTQEIGDDDGVEHVEMVASGITLKPLCQYVS